MKNIAHSSASGNVDFLPVVFVLRFLLFPYKLFRTWPLNFEYKIDQADLQVVYSSYQVTSSRKSAT